jgi:two-component system, NarL family, nitrate/nitrite response regulator NarL
MKILIADAHPLLRAGVLRRLEREHGFELVGLTRSGTALQPIVDGLRPHVVLLDSSIPDADWLRCVARMCASDPAPKVVVMSTGADPTQVEEAFKSGASAYVLKSIPADDLASAIRQAVQGTAYHASGLPGLTEALATRSAASRSEPSRPLTGSGGAVSRREGRWRRRRPF